MSHTPVMLPEVLDALRPEAEKIYVDGTFGAGGYTRAILERSHCQVIAIDRDPDAEKRARAFQEEFKGRFEFIRGCFGDVGALLQGRKVDGFVLDIGVSSFQLDEAERGFSFRFDGPLDMRMDPTQGQSAADLVNILPEEELANLIYRYGEERKSRWVSKRVVLERKERPFVTTQRLAECVRAVVPRSKDGIDPATRTFQALRIAVNDELGELERALNAAPQILKPQGRIAVVTFHSLEDRIVKQAFKEMTGRAGGGSRYLPVQEDTMNAPTLTQPIRKAIAASKEEQAVNPRARSAKLRWALKVKTEDLS